MRAIAGSGAAPAEEGKTMTAEEFESAYASRSRVTVEQLHAWGRYAEPCDCGDELCAGWAMGHQWEDAIMEDQIRKDSQPVLAPDGNAYGAARPGGSCP
jgi:hypothetical protein